MSQSHLININAAYVERPGSTPDAPSVLFEFSHVLSLKIYRYRDRTLFFIDISRKRVI